MQNGERDKRISSLTVSWGELFTRCSDWCEREVPNKACNEGADGFEDRTCKKGLEKISS